MSHGVRSIVPALLLLLSAPVLSAQESPLLDSTMLAALRWRPIGPANMSGRITDIEGIPSPSKTFFVAAAAGGIWKTTNAGVTFRPVFDHERVVSMGDLAIAPSDTMIVWAGTGEEDSRNSISPGGGIYKSTDGGLTWTLMGLEATQVIGRIVVHPTNPDIVYVAALGHVWDANPERGLYKTTDGGKTWRIVKFISDRAGFVDVAMHPTKPDILFAASWERVRGPYFLRSGGPGSALWKTTDGGATWAEVKGGGFPETMKGRIGIAFAPSNPDVIYTMVEADTLAGTPGRLSGLYRSQDGGATWERTSSNNVRPFYYSQVRVDVKNPDRVYWSSTPVNVSDDGGKTARNATVGLHVDHHAMWLDSNDPDHFVVGNDGGIGITWDKGGNYIFANTMPLGQFYHVSYNMEVPYRVCGGLQDNGTWCGPSRKSRGEISNFDWFTVNGGDGFYSQQDPEDPDIVYAESQGGNMARINVATGVRTSLQKPDWRPRWTVFEDSIAIDWPDTTVRLERARQRRVDDLRRQQRADSAVMSLRWNWNTPFFISRHNPSVFYAGANKVMKSTRRGDGLYPVSPDLTTRDTMRIRVSTTSTGGITPDVTGAETHSTITTLAESPIRPGILFAGTDDGKVRVSRNDGGTWDDITSRFSGVPAKTWVSRIEPSNHDSLTFYVTFDGHRDNDFRPYVYATNDFGATLRSIAANLPTGGPDFVHVIKEDPYNRDLLFVGTDVGAYVSTNRGTSWQRFMTGLPTVPVYDLQIHPRDRELIAATHGRSIWIVDIHPLEHLTPAVAGAPAHLFAPKVAYEYGDRIIGGGSTGHQWFSAPVPAYGAEIVYRLTAGEPRSRAELVITDAGGDTVQTLTGPGGPGLHRVTWNFRGRPPAGDALSPAQRRDSLRFIARVDQVFDSLVQGGMNATMLNRMRDAIKTGNMQDMFRRFAGGGGGGQRSGGAAGGWADRPGETSGPARGGAAQGEGQQAAEEGGEAAMPAQSQIQDILRALRPPGSRGGGFNVSYGTYNPTRRGAGPLMPTGDYLVTLKVGDQTLRQVLRVERRPGTEDSGSFFEARDQ
jgi:Sortilin, neurotensin receptor 3,